MATGPQQKRKELREKRLKAEASAKGGDKRQNLMKIVGLSAFVAIVAVVIVVIVASGGDSDDSGSNDTGGTTNASVTDQLAGLEQNGSVLGNPDAKVTLVEFGDLQCPICKLYTDEVLPDVIGGPIKAGDANLDFRQWAILGEGSVLAGKAALAAGEQNKYWEFVETFYDKQGPEGSGYVTDEFLTEIANEAGVPDIDKWNVDRESDAVEQQLLKIDDEASSLGISGTPSYAVQVGNGELKVINANSTDPAENAKTINKAIADAKAAK